MYLSSFNLKQYYPQKTENKVAKFTTPQNKPEQSSTNFSGFTRLVMNTPKSPRPFYSIEEFVKISNEFKSKIVGELPKEFLGLFPNESKKLFKFFNELSGLYRHVSTESPELLKELTLILSSGKQIKTTNLDEGNFGRAFQIKINDKSYAFKAFFGQSYADASNGSIPEIRTGLNTCGKDYCDMGKFHIGSFEKDNEWQIMEYIDKTKDSSSNRTGVKIREDRPDLILGDDEPRNRINGIRVDFGSVDKKKLPSLTKVDLDIKLSQFPIGERKQSFYDYLNHPDPEARKEIVYQIDYLEPNDKKQAFYNYIDHKYNGAETNTKIKAIWLLDERDRKDAFYFCLNHLDPEVRKGMASQNQIGCLNAKDRKQAFYDCLNHPDSKVRNGIQNQIECLKLLDKRQAFYDCLNHFDPKVRKGINYQIERLPIGCRKQAFYSCLNHSDPEVKKNIRFQITCLDQDDSTQAFYDCLNHPDPEVRKGIQNQITLLEQNETTQAFYDCLNHTDPEIRKGINNQIKHLEQKDRTKAFYACLNHPDPEVKKEIYLQINFLFPTDQKQAYKNYFDLLKKSITLFKIDESKTA